MNYLRLFVYNFFKSFRRLVRASPPGARAMLTIGSFLFNHYVRHAALAWIEYARFTGGVVGRHVRRICTPPSYRPESANFPIILAIPAATDLSVGVAPTHRY